MPISDYKPATAVVPFKGGQLDVRGLTLEDVAILLRTHLVDLDKIVEMFQGGVHDSVTSTMFAKYALKLARQAPGLVANIIALACDDGDDVDPYRKLGMAVQVDAIEHIGRLTFEEAGGPKKFVEKLKALLQGMRPMETASLT